MSEIDHMDDGGLLEAIGRLHSGDLDQAIIKDQLGDGDLAAAFGVSRGWIRARRGQLRADGAMPPGPPPSPGFTPDEDARILRCRRPGDAVKLARELGRSPGSIRCRKSHLLRRIASGEPTNRPPGRPRKETTP